MSLTSNSATSESVSPALWSAVTDAIQSLEKLVWDNPRISDDLTRAEGIRYLSRLVAGAIPMTMECWNSDYPSMLKFLSTRIQYGLPAADALYHWAAVHGDHVYRIRGQRGSSLLMDCETRHGHFANIDGWQICDRRNEFELGDDGSIEIVLSHHEQPGNWVKIPEGPGDIVFRQYFYDWDNETQAQLHISRDGARFPAPPISPSIIAERTEMLLNWLNKLPAFFASQVDAYYQQPSNEMAFDQLSIGWAALQYGKGNYEVGEDEALLVELVPPKADYWSLQLYSHYWDARDWQLRQTSINGHQAQLDEDGIFRGVIAHRDPGVRNWLDAAGHTMGLLSARYIRAQDTPVPKITRIKFSDIDAHFPNPAQHIDADERSAILQRRYESAVRRGCL
ncbi:DUF1214 domain-containing protein [Spongiibacter taiwanensis]|uniref:DUF1214 domain-containing protein n=1 Tax=Spongiibacter taiwanensis TaxID=1748242 RepID=UPI0020365583|nr:DUF1214 domain-containing protein [Spongiibacter taiwanensis]USA42019.1 DUF1214 domain-containing protein [Spongiibacter taiwanensis]